MLLYHTLTVFFWGITTRVRHVGPFTVNIYHFMLNSKSILRTQMNFKPWLYFTCALIYTDVLYVLTHLLSLLTKYVVMFLPPCSMTLRHLLLLEEIIVLLYFCIVLYLFQLSAQSIFFVQKNIVFISVFIKMAIYTNYLYSSIFPPLEYFSSRVIPLRLVVHVHSSLWSEQSFK